MAGAGEQLVSGPIVVFMGAPGSGKSTQAAATAKELNVPIVSSADLVKENAAELKKAQTPGITGIEPETDPLLNKFFEARLQRGDLSKGMILDGYPNTKDHADFVRKLIAEGVIPRPIIINLTVPDDVVRKRLGGKDAQVSASVEQRLKDYHREFTSVEIYFPGAGITNVDGTKKPKAVTKEINAILKAKLGK